MHVCTLPKDVFYPAWRRDACVLPFLERDVCVCFTLPGDGTCVSPCPKTRTWREKSNHIQTLVLCALVYDRSVCTNSSRMKINTHITVTHTTYLYSCVTWVQKKNTIFFSVEQYIVPYCYDGCTSQTKPRSRYYGRPDTHTTINLPTETSRSLHSNRR